MIKVSMDGLLVFYEMSGSWRVGGESTIIVPKGVFGGGIYPISDLLVTVVAFHARPDRYFIEL